MHSKILALLGLSTLATAHSTLSNDLRLEHLKIELQSMINNVNLQEVEDADDDTLVIDLDEMADESFAVPVYEFGSGDKFMVKVEENPSTGYSWKFTSNCGIKTSILDNRFDPTEPEADQTVLPGSPGVHTWTFITAPEVANYEKGVPCTITFTNGRAWEDTVIKSKSFSINLS